MALYLKYRPRDFDSLIGQDFIKETLQKAVAEDKTVGAYLFCGPRGTGKTSTARILAKAINCLKPKKGNPCNKCEICETINNESLIDVIEIDAASNTGVDNIRDLIEKAKYRPTKAKYKVYIIDEVHMLSKGAFNALLKILEEPPKYLKFILATTETHKVPETIISRTQRYDFKNINSIDLKKRLDFIAKEEKIQIDEKSLNYIVENSAGAARTAINIFEQLNEDNKIIYDRVIEKLGTVSNEILKNFYTKLKNKDNSVIKDFENLIDSGKNIKLFFKDLIFYIKDELLKNLDNLNPGLEIIEILNDTYSKTKNTLDENTTFLIGILKIVNNPLAPLSGGINYSTSPDKGNGGVIQEKCIYSDIQEKKEELKPEDISEIFPVEEKEISNNSDNKTENIKLKNFDKKEFIKKLKELKAKGGLTMGILGGDCNYDGENLEIKFKTSIALKSADTAENIELMKKALEKMNLGFGKIILKNS